MHQVLRYAPHQDVLEGKIQWFLKFSDFALLASRVRLGPPWGRLWGPFWIHLGSIEAPFAALDIPLESIWDSFGVLWHFLAIMFALAIPLVPFGVHLESIWGPFGVHLGSIWSPWGPIQAPGMDCFEASYRNEPRMKYDLEPLFGHTTGPYEVFLEIDHAYLAPSSCTNKKK